MSRSALITVLAFLLAACTETGPDRSAATAAAVLEADRQLAELAAREGAPYAFRQRLADDAVWLPGAAEPVRGNAAATWLKNFEDALEWTPLEAWGSASGELGITRGRWVTRGIDAEGNPRVREGNYLTVWRKDEEGWKVEVDMRGDINLARD